MSGDLLTGLPAELLRKVVKKLPFDDQLNLRAVSRCLNTFVTPEITPKKCTLRKLIVQQIKNTIRCTAVLNERKYGLNFIDLDARKTNVRRIGRSKELQFTLSSSVDECANASMPPLFPVYLTPENLRWLTRLLTGCVVMKANLVLEKSTAAHIEEVPALLRHIRTTMLTLVVQKTAQFDMLAHIRQSNFCARLAQTGVRNISFVVDSLFGSVDAHHHGADANNRTDFGLLEQLVNAGMKHSVMDLDGFEREGFQRFQLLPFLRTLSLASHGELFILIKNRNEMKTGENTYRLSHRYPRYLVEVVEPGRHHPKHEVRITTLAEEHYRLDLVTIPL